MFCPNCGAQTSVKLKNCVYCDYNMDELNKLLGKEQDTLIQDCFPLLSNSNGFNIDFAGRKIHYDKHFEQLSKTNTVLNRIINIHCKELNERIDKSKGLIDLSTACVQKGDELLEAAIELTVMFLNKNSVDVTKDDFGHIGYRNLESIDTICSMVYQLDNIEEYAQEIREWQRSNSSSSGGGRWVGGGFGIGGALKGVFNAALLNAGTEAMKGTASALSSFVQTSMDKREIDKLKRNVFNAGELQKEMKRVFKTECGKITATVKEKLFPGMFPEYDADKPPTGIKDEDVIFYFAENFPYDIYIYAPMYDTFPQHAHDISNIGELFSDIDEVHRMFLMADSAAIQKNPIKPDDSEEVMKSKWKTAFYKPLFNNLAYENPNLRFDNDVLEFKNELFSVWARFFKTGFDKELKKCANISDPKQLWSLAENNPPIEYFIYRCKEKEFEEYIKSGNMEMFIKNSTELIDLVETKKSSLALCIWTAIALKIAANRGEDCTEYQKGIAKLADRKNVLAISLSAEYLLDGVGTVKKDPFMAECILRAAALNHSPLAVAYIGRFFANGEFGYEKNISVAEEFLRLGKMYMVPFAGRELQKLAK